LNTNKSLKELIEHYKKTGVELKDYNLEGAELLLYSIIKKELTKKVIIDLESLIAVEEEKY